VPIEHDIQTTRSLPSTPLVSQAVAWLVEAFAKGGIPTIGPRLWGVLRDAGLRPLVMIGIQPHFGPDDPAAVALADGFIRIAATAAVPMTVASTSPAVAVGEPRAWCM